MPADATNIKYRCPFCGEEKSTERKVRVHVNVENDKLHSGKNGFEMDETIERVDERNKKKQDTRLLEEGIIKAAERVEERDNDGVRKVAEAAGVHHSYVMRVWEENGIEYTWKGRRPPTTWEELSDKQKRVLRKNHKHNGEELPISDDPEKADGWAARKPHLTSQGDLAVEADVDPSFIGETLRKYGWLLKEKYRPEDLKDSSKEVIEFQGEEEFVPGAGLDELVDDAKKKGVLNCSEAEVSNMEERDLMEKLEDAGVEYSLQVFIEEDDFDAISKLIKAGYEDTARELNEGEL